MTSNSDIQSQVISQSSIVPETLDSEQFHEFACAEQDSGDSEKKSDQIKFDIHRPQLTVQQAASVLGRSVRALERSLLGRWGNKLPEGWTARKVKTEGGEEWRIIPPANFRVRSHAQETEKAIQEILAYEETEVKKHPFEILDLNPVKRPIFKTEHDNQTTIVIDRSEEVEMLLRELLSAQKALSEERRLHMEDLRTVAQLQSSLRLIESDAAANSRAQSELETAKKELEQLKAEYNEIVSLPWWKRLFGFGK